MDARELGGAEGRNILKDESTSVAKGLTRCYFTGLEQQGVASQGLRPLWPSCI